MEDDLFACEEAAYGIQELEKNRSFAVPYDDDN